MKLVFVHGAGESSLSFYYQLRHFRNSKGLDLPGHPGGRPCSSVEGYVEWVRGFIAARRYKDVVIENSLISEVGPHYPDQSPVRVQGH